MTDPASLEAEIHKRRLACGARLQPTYAKFLEMLDSVLTEQLNEPHPYDLNDDKLDRFAEQTKIFSKGGIGAQARPSGSYIYRIIKKGHLEYFVKFRQPVFSTIPNLLWNSVMTKSQRGKLWLSLENYAEGAYPGDEVNRWFNCTWWTTYPLDEDVILGAYTIGMFSEWVTDQIYIMRALVDDVNMLNVTHVPTVIDAFMQPVFQPVKEPLPETGGITINLSAYEELTAGVNEFFVRPIDISLIEFKPVQIDVTTRARYRMVSQEDAVVWQSLVNYYDGL